VANVAPSHTAFDATVSTAADTGGWYVANLALLTQYAAADFSSR
jgi:hypothetical protein